MKFKIYIQLLLLICSVPTYSASIIFEQNDNVVGTLRPFLQNYHRETLPPLVQVEDHPKQQTIFENGTYKQMAGQLGDYSISPYGTETGDQYVNGILLAGVTLYKSDWTSLRKFYDSSTKCAGDYSNIYYSQVQFSPDGDSVVAIRSCLVGGSGISRKLNHISDLVVYESRSGRILRAISDVRQFVWINSDEMILSNSPAAPNATNIEYDGWCNDGFSLGSKFRVDKFDTKSGAIQSLWSVVREFDSCATDQAEWVELNIRPDLNYGFVTHVKEENTEGIGFQISDGAVLHQLSWAESGLTIEQHPYTYVASATSFVRVQPTDSEIRYSFFDKTGAGGFVRKLWKKNWDRLPFDLLYMRDGLLEIDRKNTSAIFYKTANNVTPEVINFCDIGVPANLPKISLLTDIHFVAEMSCTQKDGSSKYSRKIWEIK